MTFSQIVWIYAFFDFLWIIAFNTESQKNNTFEPHDEISNNLVCATSKGSDQPAHTRSLIRAAFASRFNILSLLSN